MAKKLLPNMIPTKPVGNGPLIPVGIFIVGLSGVNIVEVVELRSNPALPGVALMSSVMTKGMNGFIVVVIAPIIIRAWSWPLNPFPDCWSGTSEVPFLWNLDLQSFAQ